MFVRITRFVRLQMVKRMANVRERRLPVGNAAKTMITITPISVAAVENLFEGRLHSSGIPDSLWMGEVSAYFRLEGPVQRQPLVSLFKGLTPDGKVPFFSQIHEAVPDGWLIQFTAPPTVQNLWAMAPDRDRTEIEACHEHGSSYCLYSLERALRGPTDGRLETQIPGLSMAVVPSDPLKQTVPQVQTDAFLPNLHLPIHGAAQRVPFCPDELAKKAKRLNVLYNEKLFGRLHWSLGLEFTREASKECRIIGVPESLDFSQEQSGKRRSGLSRLLHSPRSLKFQEWQSRVEGRGWSKEDAKALMKFSREKKSIWSTFEKAKREKEEKIRTASEPPKKVTKTWFKTTTTTHTY